MYRPVWAPVWAPTWAPRSVCDMLTRRCCPATNSSVLHNRRKIHIHLGNLRMYPGCPLTTAGLCVVFCFSYDKRALRTLTHPPSPHPVLLNTTDNQHSWPWSAIS